MLSKMLSFFSPAKKALKLPKQFVHTESQWFLLKTKINCLSGFVFHCVLCTTGKNCCLERAVSFDLVELRKTQLGPLFIASTLAMNVFRKYSILCSVRGQENHLFLYIIDQREPHSCDHSIYLSVASPDLTNCLLWDYLSLTL